MHLKSIVFATVLPMLTLTAGLAGAVPIPVSYVIDKATTNGSYPYNDRTGKELIDGQLGRAGISVDLGNGTAAEWLAWQWSGTVNIDFSFAGPTAIGGIHVGSTQHDGVNHYITLPSLQIYQWQGAWMLAGSVTTPAYNPAYNGVSNSLAPHPFVDLTSLNIVSDRVRLSVIPTGRWTFIDEVKFDGPAEATSNVPEPGALALMGLGLGMLGWTRRRNARGSGK